MIRSVQVGCFSFQKVLLPEKRPLFLFTRKLGPDLARSHLTRRSSSAVYLQTLSDYGYRSLAIAQRFVDLSAQPQPMQQYG